MRVTKFAIIVKSLISVNSIKEGLTFAESSYTKLLQMIIILLPRTVSIDTDSALHTLQRVSSYIILNIISHLSKRLK